jgi:hypothetical protein
VSFCAVHIVLKEIMQIHVMYVLMFFCSGRAEIDGKSQDRRGNFVSQHQGTGNQKKKKSVCQEALHLL